MKISSMFAALALMLVLAPAGCADESELQSRTLQPPITDVFDPGATPPNGGSASGSGVSGSGVSGSGSSGSSGAGGMDAGPSCPDALKRCAHDFTYPVGPEMTVELRGSFAPGAWDTGLPLSKVGAVWTVTVDLPWDVEILYKFVVDGVWVTDPNNPYKADDGFGDYNSLLIGVTCDDWTCAN
jgi:Glycogen recognition site of AMP-activated protein kinase